MHVGRRIRNLYQFLIHRDRLERELDEEVNAYIEMATSNHLDRGASEEEARRLARIELGGTTQMKELDRAARAGFGLDSLVRDVRFSLRTLGKDPRFTLIVVLTLTLGIGASTAIFSVLNSVLLEDLPYNDPDRLYMLRSLDDEGGRPTGLVAPRWVQPLMADHPSVEAATYGWGLRYPILAADGTPHQALAYWITPDFYDVFNGPMALGRGFEVGEPLESLVISHRTWRDHFGSDPDIIGAPVMLDNSARTVVGVAREGFEFPNGAEAWQPERGGPETQDVVSFGAYLRLRPGVPAERLERELSALSIELGENVATGEPIRFALVPLLDEVVGDLRSTVLILSGATALLLLIACTNVANLLFARARTRAREVGLRVALGASRVRVLRHLLTECLILSGASGVLGVLAAMGGIRLLLGLGTASLPRLDEIAIDARVLAFSIGIVLVTTLLVGLAPAIRMSRPDLRKLIDQGRPGASLGTGDGRVFGTLVVLEVALAVVLVFGACLLVRSYVNLATTDPGFDFDRILTLHLNATHVPIDARMTRTPDGEVVYEGTGYQPVTDFYAALKARIRGMSGVGDVADGNQLPLYGSSVEGTGEPFFVVGRVDVERRVLVRTVSPNFFALLDVPMVAGRALEPTDRRGAPGVALVNEAFARRHFPGESPVGHRLELPNPSLKPGALGWILFSERIYDSVEIVGVVADVRFADLREPPAPYVFMTNEQFTTKTRSLVVATDFENPGSLVPAIRRELADLAPTVPVEFAVYSETVEGAIARQRLGMALLSVFGVIALVLAAVGIYGVMAYSVTQRTGELALRAALGGSALQVLGMVVRRGVLLGLAGVVLGLGGAVALRRVVSGQLYGISALDPGVLASVAVILLGVSVLASFIPALRAARIDPMAGLRSE